MKNIYHFKVRVCKSKKEGEPGTETARIEMGFGRLRLNRKETEFGGEKLELEDGRGVGRRRIEGQRVVIAEDAIGENRNVFFIFYFFGVCLYFVNERM